MRIVSCTPRHRATTAASHALILSDTRFATTSSTDPHNRSAGCNSKLQAGSSTKVMPSVIYLPSVLTRSSYEMMNGMTRWLFPQSCVRPYNVPMSVMVHLVRHAQTTWNVEGRFLGAADIPLTPLGQAHARQLVTAFADVPLVAVYASDLCRARDTAAPVAAAHGLPVQTDARLREMNQGELEGYRGAELRARPEYDAFFAEWARESVDAVAPGGESLRQTLTRASAALAAIVGTHRDCHPGGDGSACARGLAWADASDADRGSNRATAGKCRAHPPATWLRQHRALSRAR